MKGVFTSSIFLLCMLLNGGCSPYFPLSRSEVNLEKQHVWVSYFPDIVYKVGVDVLVSIGVDTSNASYISDKVILGKLYDMKASFVYDNKVNFYFQVDSIIANGLNLDAKEVRGYYLNNNNFNDNRFKVRVTFEFISELDSATSHANYKYLLDVNDKEITIDKVERESIP